MTGPKFGPTAVSPSLGFLQVNLFPSLFLTPKNHVTNRDLFFGHLVKSSSSQNNENLEVHNQDLQDRHLDRLNQIRPPRLFTKWSTWWYMVSGIEVLLRDSGECELASGSNPRCLPAAEPIIENAKIGVCSTVGSGQT